MRLFFLLVGNDGKSHQTCARKLLSIGPNEKQQRYRNWIIANSTIIRNGKTTPTKSRFAYQMK